MAEQSPHPEPSTPKRNTTHYSDSVVFQVEDELFKVPKSHLSTHSEVFRDMFSVPQGGTRVDGVNVLEEGMDDSRPIVLQGEGVTKSAFSALLDVLYPPVYRAFCGGSSRWHDNLKIEATRLWDLSIDQWISVHALAKMWMMDDIAQIISMIVESLVRKKLTDVQRVIYGRTYKREDWLLKGYSAITNSRWGMTEADIGLIGEKASFELLQMTVRRLTGHRDVDVDIEDAFKEEIEDIQRAKANGEGFQRPGMINKESS